MRCNIFLYMNEQQVYQNRILSIRPEKQYVDKKHPWEGVNGSVPVCNQESFEGFYRGTFTFNSGETHPGFALPG